MCNAALSNGQLVGAVACRLELQQDQTAKLYILTLGVLAPYRGMRVGELDTLLCIVIDYHDLYHQIL